MSIVRWDPFRDGQSLQRSINRLFDDTIFGGEENVPAAASWMFPVDIKENSDKVVVRAEIPGIKGEDIKINLHDNQLTIQGERKQEKEEKGDRFIRVERSYGSFYRAFTVGVPVKADEIKASYKDGILDVVIPKEEKARPKEIQIEVS
ncbi:MAG TPA: Hsp20/alpha crystallin family protein [Spirochaetia bacterium]|nr:Hsp20/alpha crystallin family protein [Spirochaetia bacterium]